MAEPQINSQLLKQMQNVLQDAPVDWKRLYRKAGVSSEELNNPKCYISLETLSSIWQMAIEQTGDPHLCVRYYDHERASFLSNLYGGLISLSTDLLDLVALYRDYQSLQNIQAISVTLHQEQGLCVLQLNTPGEGVVRDSLGDYYLLYAESVLRMLSGSGYKAKRLHVLRHQPDKALYYRHFGKVEIKPGYECTRLFSDLEVLDRRFTHHNPQLSDLIRDSADQRLKWLESEQKSLGGRVKTRLLTQLGVEDISADKMAADLGFSRATFFRRLREEGTSFQKILDQVRHDSAVRLLLGNKWEWHEIGDMLGFPNSNHFRRFFQKYEAMSPRAYRLHYRDA